MQFSLQALPLMQFYVRKSISARLVERRSNKYEESAADCSAIDELNSS